MEASGEPLEESLAVSHSQPRPPARWCWPLILFSIIPLGWLLGSLRGTDAVPDPERVVAADPAELAMLKMQGQVIIASQRFNPDTVELMLDDLSRMASSPSAVAALALIENFVLPESERAAETVKKLPAAKMPVTAGLVEKAIRSGLTAEERVQLQKIFGEWFAGLPPGEGGKASPGAALIRSRSTAIFLVGTTLFLCAFAGLLAGAVLVVIHGTRMRSGLKINALSVNGPGDGVYLECFALYLGVMSIGALVADFLHFSVAIVASIGAVVLPFVWPFFRKVSWSEFRSHIGWHRGKGILREIGAGIVGYLGVLSIASIGITLTGILIYVSTRFADDAAGTAAVGPEPHPIVGWIFEGSLSAKLACLFLASVFAPFFEETFFRGMFHRHLRGQFSFLIAALIGGLIFAVLHPQGFYAVPALASMGVGFALIREWRDSLIASMVAHAINNGVLVLALWAVL